MAGRGGRGAAAVRRWALAVVGAVMVGAVVAGGALVGCASDPPAAQPQPTTAVLGLVNYRQTHPEWLTNDHHTGALTYPVSPPVGGDHNPVWQNCDGKVYRAPVHPEHAVHSLEHGAVWVTYRPGLTGADVEKLAAKVRDKPYLLMSPYPGLDVPVSLQAWGYQLRVDSVTDKRIDDFIEAYRETASLEPGATCSGGTDATS